jgi:hypothetical protein
MMEKDRSRSGATRNKLTKYRFDLLVWEFIDEMAGVMGEGAISHGEPGDDGHWQKGFDDEQRDIWGHIYEHQRRWRLGDRSEPHLAKMAIGCMFQWYFDKQREEANEDATDTQETRIDGKWDNTIYTGGGDGCTPAGDCGIAEWYETDPEYLNSAHKKDTANRAFEKVHIYYGGSSNGGDRPQNDPIQCEGQPAYDAKLGEHDTPYDRGGQEDSCSD